MPTLRRSRRGPIAAVAAVALLLSVSACASHEREPVADGAPTLPDPTTRACPAVERPRDPLVGWARGCESHDECTEGEAGRCTRVLRGDFRCTYDECDSAADCREGTLCGCAVGPLAQDRCLLDRCAGACAPTECDVSYACAGPGQGSYSAVAFECHTPGDECRTSADCAPGEFCTRGPRAGGAPFDHWRCEPVSCSS